MNKVILLGRLVRDLELRESGDVKFTPFSLAINEGQEKVTFVDCVAFGKTAEILGTYVGKGNRVLVEGYLDTGSYMNAQGERVKTCNVVVNNVKFIDFKQVDERTEEVVQPVQPVQPKQPSQKRYGRY